MATSAATCLPAASSCAGLSTHFQSVALTPPVSMATTGMTMPSTSAVTILPKAPPITTPTARSTTLPRAMKALNSRSMPMLDFPVDAVAPPESLAGRGRGCDPSVQFGHPVEARDEAVAHPQRTDPGRRAHEHQVACTQGVERG